ncbi:MAG: glycosyltransferase family 2 protein [Planctomycetaceae bacterium]
MSRDATLIIPQCNQLDLTRRCCQTLQRTQTVWPEILIVDDGSDVDLLSDALPELDACGDLLQLPHRGVTAAWNSGCEAARTRWVILLNNDVWSLGPWCEQLLAPLRAGVATLTGVEWRDERQLPAALAGRWERWLSGWCLAIERSRLLDLGGFDPDLALYFSDTDLQIRLRRMASPVDPLLAVSGLPIRHAGHQTAHRLRDVREQWQRDRRTFHRKWRHLGSMDTHASQRLAQSE